MAKTYKFTSNWSNHPNGTDSKTWEPCEPPEQVEVNGKTIQLYDKWEREYIPSNFEDQKPKNGYYQYPDTDIKVKIEESGNTSAPFGTYTKRVTFLNLSKYL